MSLQSQGTINKVRLYGPSTIGWSQSQLQPQTNVFVSTQSTILLYLLVYVNFGLP
jgi:hypothetical protein